MERGRQASDGASHTGYPTMISWGAFKQNTILTLPLETLVVFVPGETKRLGYLKRPINDSNRWLELKQPF